MTVAQQARDAVAIIKAMGADKAIVFGEQWRCHNWSLAGRPRYRRRLTY